MSSPNFSEEMQPRKYVVSEKSLKCASCRVLRAMAFTFVCQYTRTTAVDCSLLFSLHFFCPSTWRACASFCTEMVLCNPECAWLLWAGCRSVRGQPGRVDKEQVHAVCGAGCSPVLPLTLLCTYIAVWLLLCCYFYPLLELQRC